MRASAVIRFGITGHQNIPADARDGIETRIRAILAPHHGGGLAGIGCLAGGADQLFARCVLDLGGILEVVIPCHGYETTFAGATEHDVYHAALAVAASVERLPYDAPSEEAFMAAGVVVADRCDLLIAVWTDSRRRAWAAPATWCGTPARSAVKCSSSGPTLCVRRS